STARPCLVPHHTSPLPHSLPHLFLTSPCPDLTTLLTSVRACEPKTIDMHDDINTNTNTGSGSGSGSGSGRGSFVPPSPPLSPQVQLSQPVPQPSTPTPPAPAARPQLQLPATFPQTPFRPGPSGPTPAVHPANPFLPGPSAPATFPSDAFRPGPSGSTPATLPPNPFQPRVPPRHDHSRRPPIRRMELAESVETPSVKTLKPAETPRPVETPVETPSVQMPSVQMPSVDDPDDLRILSSKMEIPEGDPNYVRTKGIYGSKAVRGWGAVRRVGPARESWKDEVWRPIEEVPGRWNPLRGLDERQARQAREEREERERERERERVKAGKQVQRTVEVVPEKAVEPAQKTVGVGAAVRELQAAYAGSTTSDCNTSVTAMSPEIPETLELDSVPERELPEREPELPERELGLDIAGSTTSDCETEGGVLPVLVQPAPEGEGDAEMHDTQEKYTTPVVSSESDYSPSQTQEAETGETDMGETDMGETETGETGESGARREPEELATETIMETEDEEMGDDEDSFRPSATSATIQSSGSSRYPPGHEVPDSTGSPDALSTAVNSRHPTPAPDSLQLSSDNDDSDIIRPSGRRSRPAPPPPPPPPGVARIITRRRRRSSSPPAAPPPSTPVSSRPLRSSLRGPTAHITRALKRAEVDPDEHYLFAAHFLLTYLSPLELYTELMRYWDALLSPRTTRSSPAPAPPPGDPLLYCPSGSDWPDRALNLLSSVQFLSVLQQKEMRTPTREEVARIREYTVDAGFGGWCAALRVMCADKMEAGELDPVVFRRVGGEEEVVVVGAAVGRGGRRESSGGSGSGGRGGVKREQPERKRRRKSRAQ
ncbi:hypothetical protein EDC01DRAFT_752093, partial [Geopyxis carbonaria]